MHTVRLILSLFIVLLWTLPAHSGPLDEFYLAKFRLSSFDRPTAYGAVAISAPARFERCRTWLYHDLRRDWDRLEPETRKALTKILPARPALTGESVVLSNGGHFRIHYATSGLDAPPLADANGNAIPEWIETVADVFEAVYNREVTEMGYQAPPTLGGAPYDVYLRDVGAEQIFGETLSDTAVTGTSFTSYLVIDNNFSAAEFGNQIDQYTPEKALQITAAHEFHHAIQFGYNFFFESWYAEATSTWIEDEVFNSVNQLYNYLPDYMRNTDRAIDIAPDVSLGGGYGRWVFNRYLAELHSPTFIRTIWERLKTLPSPGNNLDVPMLPVIDQTLQSVGSNLPTVFLGFNRRLLLRDWTSHQNEINLIHPVAVENITVTADSFTVPAVILPTYSFQNFQLQRGSQTPVTLMITYPERPATNAFAAFKVTGPGVTAPFTPDLQSDTITIPSFSSVADVFLLVSNNTAGAVAFPSEPVQVVATPEDATNPFPGLPTLVSSTSTPPPAPASDGGGGGCFIATAAFGSYLHPKVQILRTFRDEYLLKTPPGRAFVKLYYRLSPPVAGVVSRHEGLRTASRVLLTPVIAAVEYPRLALVLLAGGGIGGILLLYRNTTLRPRRSRA